MPLREPSFTLGIEEEYHLVDVASRDLVNAPPPALIAEAEARLGNQVATEFLRSQIEVGTKVCHSMAEARRDLAALRRGAAEICRRHGLAPIAAATHPFARPESQQHTDKARYHALARDLQGVGRRLLISGMHVHVGIDDDELRIDLLNQLRYFLPHLLVLSTSSPFFEGVDTGLKSYRLAIYNELPRTGLPGRLADWGEYQSTIDVLVRAGVIEDASKVWWDLRPSSHLPTLEMRITDVATRLDDAIAVASLYRCLCRRLYRLRRENQSWRTYPVFLLAENRWRAQRYGVEGTLFDFGKGTLVPFADLLEEIITLVAEDAAYFGCEAEIQGAREILKRGTSADRQVRVYRALIDKGASREEALRGVVDHLIAETACGL